MFLGEMCQRGPGRLRVACLEQQSFTWEGIGDGVGSGSFFWIYTDSLG